MTEPTRPELFEIYKVALEEYRFQVNLNWSRTQYYLVLNIGILGVATGILQLDNKNIAVLATGLYFAGVVCCLLSFFAARVQHGYYRRTYEHKGVVEAGLGLGPYELRTTPGMGSTVRRLGRVTTFNNALLAIIVLLDIGGIILGARLGLGLAAPTSSDSICAQAYDHVKHVARDLRITDPKALDRINAESIDRECGEEVDIEKKIR